MAYWGSGPSDNDYAFDAVSAYVFMIKERMFQEAENVIEKSYSEQAIIASLRCLRLIANEFPKCAQVHFRKKEFLRAKEAFSVWYNTVQNQLPSEYREAILSSAEAEFQLFESQVLNAN